jgi:osmotically-inducible protein OsmY
MMHGTSTNERQSIVKQIRAALEHEPRINLHKYPIQVGYSEGVVTLEGNAENIAAKKLSMELAAAVPGVGGIVDRLHVVPSTHMGDGAVLDAVRDALLQEPLLQNCTIKEIRKGAEGIVRAVTIVPHGIIRVSVTDGVVLLDDHVLTHTQKRMAGVLAWWVPGSRDVINGMAVEPEQQDSDEELGKAVRLALKKDPFVNGDRIVVGIQGGIVTLAGDVPSDPQREMAEFDAWYVFGVDKVINRLEVRP